MEKINAQEILEFHPDTFQYVRRECGLDKPGQMDAAIDLLDDWVRKQAHFTKKDFSREYLERVIIFNKGSVERAKSQLDKLFTMKILMPHFFEKVDAKNDFEDNVHDFYVSALLPKLTKDHYRIYAGKLLKECESTKMLNLAFVYGTLILEYIRLNDYCSGFVGIIDYRDINIVDLLAQTSVLELNNLISIITEGFRNRVKGIHILTSSKAVEMLLRLFKQLFSKKIGDRIRVHMSLDSLHEYIPKAILPEEFGGELKPLVEMNNDWLNVFSKKEYIEYMKEMNKAKVNEKLRDGEKKENNDILGISGSFRTLAVD